MADAKSYETWEFMFALRQHPYRWAVYPHKGKASAAAGAINHGRVAAFKRGGFEAVSRDDVVYVRYVGPVDEGPVLSFVSDYYENPADIEFAPVYRGDPDETLYLTDEEYRSGTRHVKYVGFADHVRNHPGLWADFSTFINHRNSPYFFANNIKQGLVYAFRDEGFEVMVRKRKMLIRFVPPVAA